MDPKSRPTPAGQLVYEDFEPQYLWVPTKDVDTLVVDLTGFKDEAEFKKENLKVKIDNQGNLKVSGERPLADGNRWRRFQKVFRMAEDCITTEIKAKFDNGLLSVIMPKVIKSSPPPPPPPPPSPESPAGQAPGEASAAPPAKPEPRAAAASSTKAPEEGKAQAAAPAENGGRDTARYNEEGGPAAEKPAPPQSPNRGSGTRRRWRQVVAGVVVVMVVAAVGLGLYCYWAHWNGASTDEQEQMDIFLGDY